MWKVVIEISHEKVKLTYLEQELKQELARINAAVRALQRTLNDMKPDPECEYTYKLLVL